MAVINRRLVLLWLLRRKLKIRQAISCQKKRRHRWWVRPTLQKKHLFGQNATIIPLMRENDREWYYRYMRMSPERFQHLHRMTSLRLTKRCWNRPPVSSETRLAITLRYLATGNSQASESFNFLLGRSTVSKVVREGCQAIWDALSDKYLSLPQTEQAWREIAQEFEEEWNFPNVIGALDGKHINIQCPKFGGSDFYNYKGFHSTNLMAMCDAKYRFIWVDIGSYGRDNDAAVFGRSKMYQLLDEGKANVPHPREVSGLNLPYVVLSDEIFALKPWLIKPYPGRGLTESQVIYNYRLSRARRCIENAFGILSCKWRIFRRPINANLDLIDLIVKACTALHNYLLLTDNAKYLPSGFVDSYCDNGELVDGVWRKEIQAGGLNTLSRQGSNYVAQNAKAVRDRFCSYVNSAEGSVPWQLDYVRYTGRRDV